MYIKISLVFRIAPMVNMQENVGNRTKAIFIHLPVVFEF